VVNERRERGREARVVFTDPVAYGGMTGPLRDHRGQLVRLRVARP
jgi:hypothetical protein